MRVLILGGTLFIGRRIALELLARGDDVMVVPPDLEGTRSIAQHFLVDSRKAATVLGWRPSDPAETIALSVRWHLENPPAEVNEDFSADDRALSAATS